jgi:hypothetical protein
MTPRALYILACVILYYRVGDQEYGKGFMWALISFFISILTTVVVPLGTFGFLMAQALIFAAMTAYNMRRESQKLPR